jgi:hypothetical protein
MPAQFCLNVKAQGLHAKPEGRDICLQCVSFLELRAFMLGELTQFCPVLKNMLEGDQGGGREAS